MRDRRPLSVRLDSEESALLRAVARKMGVRRRGHALRRILFDAFARVLVSGAEDPIALPQKTRLYRTPGDAQGIDLARLKVARSSLACDRFRPSAIARARTGTGRAWAIVTEVGSGERFAIHARALLRAWEWHAERAEKRLPAKCVLHSEPRKHGPEYEGLTDWASERLATLTWKGPIPVRKAGWLGPKATVHAAKRKAGVRSTRRGGTWFYERIVPVQMPA